MAFSLKVSKEAIEGKDLVSPGIYDVRLLKFNPKASKSGTSFNYNPMMEIINHPDYVNNKIYDTLNSAAGWIIPDFSHCFGFPMETDGTDYWLPGIFDADKAKFNPDDPSTWVYAGPLTGAVGKVEIGHDSYNGKAIARIGRYFCSVENCATKFPHIKHSENLLRKKSE
jgi:hypothetical protein